MVAPLKKACLLAFAPVLLMMAAPSQAVEAALMELRLGPAAAMAVHVETDWRALNMYAGGGLALPGYEGSPLRNPSFTTGFRYYTKRGVVMSPYLTSMYGWALRSDGLQPFAGVGAGIAWHFGPARSYRLTMEADLLMRGNTFAPYPTAGLGLAVQI